MEDMEDLGENSPSSPHCLTHDSTLVGVATKQFFLETPVDIFGEKSSREPRILKVLEFFTR